MRLSDAELRYHLGQYEEPYQSTRLLDDFLKIVAGGPLKGTVLDAGCGAGANVHWLNKWGTTAACSRVGIERDLALARIAQQRNPGARIYCADFLDPLPAADYVLSLQVLSFIEDWRPALQRLLAAARGYVFVSSLFWGGISTHTHATDEGHRGAHYNVIEQGEFAAGCGGRALRWFPYSSGLTDFGHDKRRLGSYTSSGRDFTGPIYLPWQLVAIAAQ